MRSFNAIHLNMVSHGFEWWVELTELNSYFNLVFKKILKLLKIPSGFHGLRPKKANEAHFDAEV